MTLYELTMLAVSSNARCGWLGQNVVLPVGYIHCVWQAEVCALCVLRARVSLANSEATFRVLHCCFAVQLFHDFLSVLV